MYPTVARFMTHVAPVRYAFFSAYMVLMSASGVIQLASRDGICSMRPRVVPSEYVVNPRGCPTPVPATNAVFSNRAKRSATFRFSHASTFRFASSSSFCVARGAAYTSCTGTRHMPSSGVSVTVRVPRSATQPAPASSPSYKPSIASVPIVSTVATCRMGLVSYTIWMMREVISGVTTYPPSGSESTLRAFCMPSSAACSVALNRCSPLRRYFSSAAFAAACSTAVLLSAPAVVRNARFSTSVRPSWRLSIFAFRRTNSSRASPSASFQLPNSSAFVRISSMAARSSVSSSARSTLMASPFRTV